jgi:hypothetical protein
MATSAMAYNVPLTIYRNREWLQIFYLQNADGTPLTIVGDKLSLVVLEDGRTVLTNSTPAIDYTKGQISFLFGDSATGTLTPSDYFTARESGYGWQFIRMPNGNPNSDLMAAGPLTVEESPPFPP